MKKLFLILAICCLIAPDFVSAKQAPEEGDIPIIVVQVNKSHAGILAIFNLYGTVDYSIVGVTADVITAQLNCSGEGYIPCKAPRNVIYGVGSAANNLEQIAQNEILSDAINYLIEYSETSFNKGQLVGSATKKITVTKNNKSELYIFTGEWNYDKTGNGKMYIKVYKNLNLLNSRI